MTIIQRAGGESKRNSRNPGRLAANGIEAPRTPSRRKRKERGLRRQRYWEHLIEEEDDDERHFDYKHDNAVKHEEANCPKDWPLSISYSGASAQSLDTPYTYCRFPRDPFS